MSLVTYRKVSINQNKLHYIQAIGNLRTKEIPLMFNDNFFYTESYRKSH